MKKMLNLDLQKIFCVSSLAFILSCILWYGGRFIYFYTENKKELTLKENTIPTLATLIKDTNYDSENFKKVDDDYYFYGNISNNYVSYSNFIWRIVKINEDDTIQLITDNIIGTLAYGNNQLDYKDSNIIQWLNNEDTGKFIKVLNEKEKYLTKTSTCIDNVSDVKNLSCLNKDSNYYLGLLSLEDYSNTGAHNGFINTKKYSYLSNKNEDNEIWYLNNEGKIDTTDGSSIMGIKTTITLSKDVKLVTGTGTLDNPYKFENSTSLIGSYVKLDQDIWRVYEESNGIIKLISQNIIKKDDIGVKYHYSDKTYYHNDTIKNSLAYYLNNTYYKDLSYKNLIIENTYVNGLYGKDNSYDYKNISLKSIDTNVSIPSLDDIIFNDNLSDYFTNTGKLDNEEAIYIRKNIGYVSPNIITEKNYIVPCISIKRENLTIGTGSMEDPYRTE